MSRKIIKHALNVLLVIVCVASIAAVASISGKRTDTIPAPHKDAVQTPISPSLPPLDGNLPISGGITRHPQLKTNIPERTNYKVTEYVVQPGDSPWSIAQKFNLKPETILWSNGNLNASAGQLKAGDRLNILPVDGVLHIVTEGDTLEMLEELHGISAREIEEYPGNDFDLAQPQLTAGQQVIIPNGTSPIFWFEAQAPVVSLTGSRGGSSSGVPNLGTGYFIWPVNSYVLTQEYWSGHPALDLSGSFRQPIFASDSGTVVFSGWDDTGYGNMIIIDHGNGFQTYYSHNEANLVVAGQTVVKGQQIAEMGSTGNSTGDHLDFRILYNGVFVNPFDYLP